MIEVLGYNGATEYDHWHIFGDPSLLLRTDNPALLTVNHSQTVLFDLPEYNVEVVGVEGALCALYHNGILYGSAYTDANGQAAILLEDILPVDEDITLTVTAFNYDTYISPVHVAPPSTPYVMLNSVTCSDVTGNNNDIIDAGESITLDINLKNAGVEIAYNVTASLLTSDPYVTITLDNQNFGDIVGDGGTAVISDCFGFDVALGLPDNHMINFDLTITDDNSNTWNSGLAFNVRSIPDINIATASIGESLRGDSRATYPLQIDNFGPGLLEYSIERLSFSNKSSGGFDNYGYAWLDSDDPEGPEFDWIDISDLGTEIVLGDDDASGTVPIGFEFSFYGINYNELYVGSNGIITFESPTAEYENTLIPEAETPNNLIALFWDNLDPNAGGQIYYYYDGANNRFIVTYNKIPFEYQEFGSGLLTFQAILYFDGTILLQYKSMYSGLYRMFNSATIGIENRTGNDGLTVIFDDYYIHDNMAIEFKASNWLAVEPATGTVDPLSSSTVEVSLSGADLEPGDYSGQLVIHSNDPETPVWNVPVYMTVLELCQCGDIDNSGIIDILDITYLIDNKFKSGPPPVHDQCADVDSSGLIDVLDIVYLIDNKFKSGPEPYCNY
jgi:hypothetical protein